MKRLSLLALALAALAGCPGSLEDPSRFDAQFGKCPDVPELFATSCAGASCHDATKPAAGLDLASNDLAGRLAGKQAEGGPGLLANPDDPEASVLYTKLLEKPPFGSRMPLGGDPFEESALSCVLEWIASPE